jgi:hypothetical protein
MSRFVIRFNGAGAKPANDVNLIQAHPALKVIDESARMLLVESDAATIDHLRRNLSDWQITAESSFSLPETNRQTKRSID